MKFVSWNVNGLRACLGKGFISFFQNMDADFFCIQETKMQEGQADIDIEGYYRYMNSAQKKGYSGTLIYAKEKPLSVIYGMDAAHDEEGRLVTLEYLDFYLVTCYTPNSQEELKRLEYRMQFEDDLRNYLGKLKELKPVVFCGDLNVAHQEIDLKNPRQNERNPGYSIEERTKMTALLASGFTDSYRYLYPDKVEYSWWSYRFQARQKNIGWRIDYFLVSNQWKDKIRNAEILCNVEGSDHCPVLLELAI